MDEFLSIFISTREIACQRSSWLSLNTRLRHAHHLLRHPICFPLINVVDQPNGQLGLHHDLLTLLNCTTGARAAAGTFPLDCRHTARTRLSSRNGLHVTISQVSLKEIGCTGPLASIARPIPGGTAGCGMNPRHLMAGVTTAARIVTKLGVTVTAFDKRCRVAFLLFPFFLYPQIRPLEASRLVGSTKCFLNHFPASG